MPERRGRLELGMLAKRGESARTAGSFFRRASGLSEPRLAALASADANRMRRSN